MMSEGISTLQDLDDKVCPVLGEYMWDHLMGEPDDPTSEQVQEACKQIRIMLYSMPEEVRNDIETK